MEEFENKDIAVTETGSSAEQAGQTAEQEGQEGQAYDEKTAADDNGGVSSEMIPDAADRPSEHYSDNTPLNKDGGVFGEKSFGAPYSQGYGQPQYGQYSPYGQQNDYYSRNVQGNIPGQSRMPEQRELQSSGYYDPYGRTAQNVYPYGVNGANGANGASPNGYNGSDPVYRNMYGQPQYGGGYYTPYSPYGQEPSPAYGGYPQQPDIPAVSPAAEVQEKKTSKGWIIAMIVAMILAVSAVMILLAMYSRNSKKDAADTVKSAFDSSGSSAGRDPDTVINVTIDVKPKPVEGEEYYQDKETGLLTAVGATKQALPSIVSLYGYTNTTITYYSEASGIIISEDGYIITNAHVVDDVSRIKARLSSGEEYEAQIIGYDTKTDLAVLKIEAENITPAVIGSAEELEPGEQVIAIGNAEGFNDTVTVGYVSYVGRDVNSYTGTSVPCVQTDAVLNYGNSGGALVNLYGQVVGIVTSKYDPDGYERMGFAIMSDFAVPIVEDIIEKGYVTGRPRVGVSYMLLTPETAASLEVKPGMLISSISADCDISNTELAKDDIITEMDGVPILSDQDIENFQKTHSAGDTVTAKVYRKSMTGEVTEFEITFKLEENKDMS